MGFVSPDFVGIHHQRGYQWIGFRERPQETIGLYPPQKKRLSCTMIQSWDLGAFGAPASGREIERVGTSELPKFRKWATKKKGMSGGIIGFMETICFSQEINGVPVYFPSILGGHTVGEKVWRHGGKIHSWTTCHNTLSILAYRILCSEVAVGSKCFFLILSNPAGSFPPSYHKISPEFGPTRTCIERTCVPSFHVAEP